MRSVSSPHLDDRRLWTGPKKPLSRAAERIYREGAGTWGWKGSLTTARARPPRGPGLTCQPSERDEMDDPDAITSRPRDRCRLRKGALPPRRMPLLELERRHPGLPRPEKVQPAPPSGVEDGQFACPPSTRPTRSAERELPAEGHARLDRPHQCRRTLSETRRRAEIPASRFSPVLRARMNSTSSC